MSGYAPIKISRRLATTVSGAVVRGALLPRQVDLSRASDIRLRFWAKGDSFENSDIGVVKISYSIINN